MKKIFITFLITIVFIKINAQEIVFEPHDSIRIEHMLNEGIKQPSTVCLPLYYGQQFINTPYVGGTLDIFYAKNLKTAKEQLIIELNKLDCTTFVEIVCALVKTTIDGKTKFTDFCNNLKLFRFKNGIMTDYPSRNHYHTTWIDNAEALHLAIELGPKDSNIFSVKRNQTINYMSTHPLSYAALKSDSSTKYLKTIKEDEQKISREIYYIPTSALNKNQKELNCIHDGDILSMVTSKAGLDVSHLGIAKWGKDGKLHLLNASSLHKKVVIEPRTLYQYQQSQKSQIGIRVVRLSQTKNTH